MSDDAAQVAERLLDAQVAYLVSQLSGPDGVALVAADLRSLVQAIGDVPVEELLDRAAVRAAVGRLLEAIGGSPGVGVIVAALVPVLQVLPDHDEHLLGDVVDRDVVATIVDVLARSQTLREEALRRLGQSPAVSMLAMRFVSALVGDAVQQNRERAEKVPGMKSLLGVGDFAARQARGMTPKQLERMVGGAADRGAQAAMERVSRAFADTFDEDAVRIAAMQVWDLHAEDAVARLRAYLTADELEHLAASGHQLWDGLRTTTWFTAVLDATVDAFFDVYGEHTVGDVLGEFGLGPDDVATEVARHAPRIIEALHRNGQLEAVIRRRLEPFFGSDETLAILADTE